MSTQTPLLRKAEGVEVPPGAPWQHDTLEREQEGTRLTRLIASIRQPFVLAIDSPWGTGKTTLIHMWTAALRSDGIHVVVLNAWENDFADDPFVALLSDIRAQLEDLKSEDPRWAPVEATLHRMRMMATGVLRRAAPLALRILTRNAVAASDLGDILDGADEELGKVAEEESKAHERRRESIDAFKLELAKLAKELGALAKNAAPLVIVVDELDRCRPPYAIALLERVKHLFAVPGVVFVLSLDMAQLAQSVRQLYGPDVDTPGYLRRFIDLRYQLAAPRDCLAFVKGVARHIGLDDAFSLQEYAGVDVTGLIAQCATSLSSPLRETEQVICRLNVILRTVALPQRICTPVLIFLLFLRERWPLLYEKYVSGQLLAHDLIRKLTDELTAGSLFEKQYGPSLDALLRWSSPMKGELDRYEKGLENTVAGNAAGSKDHIEAAARLRTLARYDIGPQRPDATKYIVENINLSAAFRPD